MKNRLLNIFTLTVLATIFLSSCVSMKMTDLKPDSKNIKLLPTLEPRIDLSSFESAYSLGTSISSSVGTVIGQSQISAIGTSITEATMSKDVRIQDAITIFDREVKDNITDPFGDSKGFILCKINASIKKLGGGWAILSILTSMIPNLFGMPVLASTITLDVDVEIYNNSEKLIARYNGIATDKKYLAAYWGYGIHDMLRVSNIMAFRKVMNQIKKEIESDYENILIELEK